MSRLSAVVAAAIYASAAMLAQEPLEGTWSGSLTVNGSSLTVVLNLSAGADGGLSCTMDSPDQGARGIPAQVNTASDISLEVAVPDIGATFKGLLFQDNLVGTLTQHGYSFPLTLHKGEITPPRRPQTPQEPLPYAQEEVTFANQAAGATLAGTLVIPEGATRAVLMITGSGLQNRDEEVFDHRPFLVIADGLARQGIATLRYDDRGTGASHGGDLRDAVTPDFMADALAGVEYLRGRFPVVGVLGHSEGANIAFMLGARREVDFVVSLAAIGVPGAEALAAQVNRILELKGDPRRLTPEEYTANAHAQGQPWLDWFVAYDPAPDISATQCPVMAVNGERDVQVIASLNLEGIKANLPEGEHNIVREYPELNHLFQHCATGAVEEYRAIEETFSPQVLADLAAWINSLPFR